MRVYIVAVIKGYRRKTLGYRLVDLDDNNKVMEVPKDKVIQALDRGAIKIYNGKLTGQAVTGTYYSLELLNEEQYTSRRNDVLILNKKVDKHGNILYVTISNSKGITRIIGLQELSALINSGARIINILPDQNGNIGIMCDSDTIDDKTIQERKEKQLSNNVQISDDEARNKDIVWDLARFDQYMKLKGWMYSIKDVNSNNILSIDVKKYIDKPVQIVSISPDATIIHLPKNVFGVMQIFSEKPKHDIDTIIINSKCEYISSMCGEAEDNKDVDMNNNLNIHRFYYQHDKNGKNEVVQTNFNLKNENINRYDIEVELDGLRCINIIDDYELPNCKALTNTFNYCKIPFIKLSKYTKKIRQSFNNIIVTEKTFRTAVLEDISYCFRSVQNLDHLKIDHYAKYLWSCFNNCKLQSIDFSSAIELKDMRSVCSNTTIKGNIDLSKCEELSSLVGCFYYDSDNTVRPFGELKLPPNLSNIYKSFFNCNLEKEINIYSKLASIQHPIFNGSVVILHNNDIIDKNIINESEVKINGIFDTNLIFKNANKIKAHAFEEARINKFVLPNTIETISDYAFKNSYLKEFDSGNTNKDIVISKECFAESSALDTVIFRENVIGIKDKALFRCNNLEKIVIGPNVTSIGKYAIPTTSDNKKPYKIYVIKGSYAHNRLKNYDNIVVRNNMDEILSDISLEATTSENQIAKFNLILGEEYKVLLSDKYAPTAKTAYKVISSLKNDADMQSDLQLNTSKFCDNELSILGNAFYNEYYDYIKRRTEKGITYEVPDNFKYTEFITVCNFITTLRDNCLELVNNIVKANKNINMKSIKYIDGDGNTILIAESHVGKEYMGGSVNIRLMCIIQNNRLKYVADITQRVFEICESDIFHRCRTCLCNYNFISKRNISTNNSLGTFNRCCTLQFMEVDDYITSEESHIYNSIIPSKFSSLLVESIMRNSTIIGLKNTNKADCINMLLLCHIDGILYDMRLEMRTSSSSYKNISLLNKYTINDFFNNDTLKEYLDLYNSSLNRSNSLYNELLAYNTIQYELLDKQSEIELVSSVNSYDINKKSRVAEIADIISINGIYTTEAISENILDFILKDDLFRFDGITHKKCASKGKLVSTTYFCGGEIRIEQYEFYTENSVILKITPDTKPNSKCGYVVSNKLLFDEYINAILKVAEQRHCNNYNDSGYDTIIDGSVNINQFILLNNIHTKTYYDYYVQVGIEINNGNVFLLAIKSDTKECRILYKAKGISEAMRILSILQLISDAPSVVCEMIFKNNIPMKMDAFVQNCVRLRDNIIYGLPNEYPYISETATKELKDRYGGVLYLRAAKTIMHFNEMFNLCAKQPGIYNKNLLN